MTDVEQRVAAALRAARFFDEGPDAQDAVDLIAALASQGLAITEAPDAEGAGLPPVNPDLIAVGSWGHYRPLKEADPAEYARLDALRRAAPPSPVDGEGLRAALKKVDDLILDALDQTVGWTGVSTSARAETINDLLTEARAALAASGSEGGE